MRVLTLLAALLALAPVALAGRSGPPPIEVRPVALGPANPEGTRLGRLTWLGGWTLASRDRRFGGLSALVADGRGLLALTDAGAPVRITLTSRGPAARLLPRLDPGRAAGAGKAALDTESLVRDPATGELLVGAERTNAVLRYAPGPGALRGRATPAAMTRWPHNGGAEAMVRLADGRLLVIAETARAGPGGRRALLFPGDPTRDSRRPLALAYRPPPGYDPSDAALLPDGRVLVLDRRASMMEGFSAILSIVDIGRPRAGAMLAGRPVARLAAPLTVDNMEGLAVTREGRRTILWLVSDDNFLPVQRTLLLKLALD